MYTKINAQLSLEQIVASRDEYIDLFRKTGIPDRSLFNQTVVDIMTFLDFSTGKSHTQALWELATMKRIDNKYDEAIILYKECIDSAKANNENEIIFNAFIGLARSYAYSISDHGRASNALDEAIRAAGDSPSRKQLYDIADYSSQLKVFRGELESALVSAMQAVDLSSNDSELFYAQLDLADILQKFAESCDYHKIIDAKSSSDRDDEWGACKRAVKSALTVYSDAKMTARRLGWDFMEKEVDGFISGVGFRQQLIEKRERFDKMGMTSLFHAEEVSDVVVNEQFLAGASELSEATPLRWLIEEAVFEKDTANPRSLYLLGLKSDLDNDPEGALDYFRKSVYALYRERSGFFDLRQQGTVVENRSELVRDMALRLLSFGRVDEAFLAFESIRAFGLSKLMAVYANAGFSDEERNVMANLIQMESQMSALQTDIVNTTIAGVNYSKSAESLKTLNSLALKIRQVHDMPVFKKLTDRIKAIDPEEPELNDLTAEVKKMNVPVIFYWITFTNVIVWVVSPEGMEVKTVFLPETVVYNKIHKLKESIASEKIFDAGTAGELYTYLIAPFNNLLRHDQLIIVPQGELVNLPFEVLINRESGKYLAEETAVSYAPNATFVLQRLKMTFPGVSKIEAIYDPDIERYTHEISGIEKVAGLNVHASKTSDLNKAKMIALLSKAEFIHVLLHGKFDDSSPLQSVLKINMDNSLTAAELLRIDWKNAKLTVFSSCEGGRAGIRISNELFGISWALIAGGADSVILSRWIVQSDKNAEWMSELYNSLVSLHLSPALAAGKAMRKMIEKDRDKPFYWAFTQVYGR